MPRTKTDADQQYLSDDMAPPRLPELDELIRLRRVKDEERKTLKEKVDALNLKIAKVMREHELARYTYGTTAVERQVDEKVRFKKVPDEESAMDYDEELEEED